MHEPVAACAHVNPNSRCQGGGCAGMVCTALDVMVFADGLHVAATVGHVTDGPNVTFYRSDCTLNV